VNGKLATGHLRPYVRKGLIQAARDQKAIVEGKRHVKKTESDQEKRLTIQLARKVRGRGDNKGPLKNCQIEKKNRDSENEEHQLQIILRYKTTTLEEGGTCWWKNF